MYKKSRRYKIMNNFYICNTCNCNLCCCRYLSIFSLERIKSQYFNASSIGGNQVISPGEHVIFDLLNNKTSIFDFEYDSDCIAINLPGTYYFSYGLTFNAPVKAAYAVTINDVEYPFSSFRIVSFSKSRYERVQLEGQFISKINSRSVIKIKNIGIEDNTLTGIGKLGVEITRAYIFITRLENK